MICFLIVFPLYFQNVFVNVCLTVSFSIVYLHVCLTSFWVVFKCMIVALFVVFLKHVFICKPDLFYCMFCQFEFCWQCSLFGLFVTWFWNDCLKLCLTCFCWHSWSVSFYFVWPCFDTAFNGLFEALFNIILVLFFEYRFWVCLTCFWHCFLSDCLTLCLICFWCCFLSVCDYFV